jgi:hypothetical protein
MIEMTCKISSKYRAYINCAKSYLPRSIQYPARYSLSIKDTECGGKIF